MSTASITPTRRDLDQNWQSRGACRDEDPELFCTDESTSVGLLQAQEAKAICRRCPVMDICYRWNIEIGEQYGVWGGTSEHDRGTSTRMLEYQRKRDRIADGRRLALEYGQEVILARLMGQTESAIAEWSGIGLFAVRHALRILLPQPGRAGATLTPLERALIHHPDAIRVGIRAERTDWQIGKFLGYTAATIADARKVLAHRDAAAAQIGQAA